MWYLLALLALLLTSAGFALIFWALIQLIDTLDRPDTDGEISDHDKRLKDLEYAVDLLPQKWEEMVKETKRAEGRAHQAVNRARKELAARGFADANLDEQADELRELDDVRGGNGGVPPVRPSVAAAPVADETESWEAALRKRKYGF